MQNNQTVTITVIVDVDRQASVYSRLAIQALDPARKGIGSKIQTLSEADSSISRTVAIAAAKYLLNRSLTEDYGASTLRVLSPKNAQESFEINPEETFSEDDV